MQLHLLLSLAVHLQSLSADTKSALPPGRAEPSLLFKPLILGLEAQWQTTILIHVQENNYRSNVQAFCLQTSKLGNYIACGENTPEIYFNQLVYIFNTFYNVLTLNHD